MFVKGQNKIGGRVKGTPNAKLQEWQTIKDYILSTGLEKFTKEMDSLKGMNYCMIFLKFLSYHKPTLQAVQVQEITQNNFGRLKDAELRKFIELTDKVTSQDGTT